MDTKLAGKLAQARMKIGSLKTDKRNKDQGYDYLSADKILERAGDIVSELGIAIIPSITRTEITTVERQGGKPRIDAVINMQFTVTDHESAYTSDWVGCGSDYATPDKAVYKAITSGHKYYLMKLLLIGVGNEDGEHENEPSEQRQPAPVRQAPITAPAQQAAPITAPAQPAPSGTPSGNITPQMLVDNGMATNIPNAAGIINKLNVGGKPAAEYWPRVLLYRKWREAGHDTDAAAIAAIAGEQLPA